MFQQLIPVVILLFLHQVRSASIPECPAHSTFNTCMTRCPTTCQNVGRLPHLPAANCVDVCTVGCECMDGFVKINRGAESECVRAYECPMYLGKRGGGGQLPYTMLRKLAAQESVPTGSEAKDSSIPMGEQKEEIPEKIQEEEPKQEQPKLVIATRNPMTIFGARIKQIPKQ